MQQLSPFFLRCFLPFQLEAGIRSGDIESFNIIERASKLIFPSAVKEKDGPRGNKRDSIGMVRIKELHVLGSEIIVSQT
jgi:hypothetical protein